MNVNQELSYVWRNLKNIKEHSTQMMFDSFPILWVILTTLQQFFDILVPKGFHEMVFANSCVHSTSKPYKLK